MDKNNVLENKLITDSDNESDDDKLFGNIEKKYNPIMKNLIMKESLGSFSWTDNKNHTYQLPSYGLYLFTTTGNSTYKRVIAYINYINIIDNEITYAKYVNYYNRFWIIKLNQNNLTFGAWWASISVTDGKTDISDYSAYIVQLINY